MRINVDFAVQLPWNMQSYVPVFLGQVGGVVIKGSASVYIVQQALGFSHSLDHVIGFPDALPCFGIIRQASYPKYKTLNELMKPKPDTRT